MQMRPLVLIPAAGFGRRVGSPEAKELFKRSDGTHLIDLGLQCARERGWPAHVITRPEKKSLIGYVENFQKEINAPPVSVQLIEPTFDWPETLLASEPYWHEWNLVFLPDMDFKPRNVLEDFQTEMQKGQAEVITANHLVAEMSKWGVLWPVKELQGAPAAVTVGEKVSSEGMKVAKEHASLFAWGMYAFKKSVGRCLLEAQLASCRDHQLRQLPLRAVSLNLEEYNDLTRPADLPL